MKSNLSNSVLSSITIFAFTAMTSAPAFAQDRNSFNAYDTASLLEFSQTAASSDRSFESAFKRRGSGGLGFGLNYTLKFGENVRTSETYGKAALNFNTNYEGKIRQAPLATLSFGSQAYAYSSTHGYDLRAFEGASQSALSVNLLGLDLDKLSADDDDSDDKDSNTDAGDIGLIVGGAGLLLVGVAFISIADSVDDAVDSI